MPWANIVGGAIDLFSNIFGALSANAEEKKRMQQAEESLNKAKGVANEQLTMWKDQMTSWEGAFGSIQKNLSSYYNSLDASTISAKYIQDIEKEFSRTQDMMQTEMASRGMLDSGTAQAQNQALHNELAKARAEARYRAPQEVVRQQQNYLQGMGLPQKGQIMSGMHNSLSNLQNIYSNEAQLRLGQAGQAGQAGAGAVAGIGSALGGIIQGAGSLIGNGGGGNTGGTAGGTAGGATGNAIGITKPAKPAWDFSKSWISQYTGGF